MSEFHARASRGVELALQPRSSAILNSSEVPMSTDQLSGEVLQKLQIMQSELGADNLESALDKSLNIAHYVAGILKDSESKLLVERNGKYQWIKKF
jgi:hypothetical protein